MKSTLLVFFLFFCTLLQAQWVVTGFVTDAMSVPLPGASIFANNDCNTTADSNGSFRLQCTELPVTLTARFVGHFSQKINLQEATKNGQTLHIEVRLNSQNPTIKEVTISSKRIETIVEEDFTKDLYDFGFMGEHLLLLTRERKKYYLRLTAESGQVLSEVMLPEQATVLHRSCLGDYHVVGKSRVWEVSLRGEQIDTLKGYTLEAFQKFVEPCVAYSDDHYIFIKRGLLNQEVTYYAFGPDRKRRKIFHIENEGGVAGATRIVGDIMSGRGFLIGGGGGVPDIGDGMPKLTMEDLGSAVRPEDMVKYVNSNSQVYSYGAMMSLTLDSVYAPILKIADDLYLFDHIHSQIVQFGPRLKENRIVPIHYQEEKGWQKLVLKDETSQRVYARFVRNGGLLLQEIDVQSGTALRSYNLDIAPFLSEKFKIRNGFLYFIGQPDMNVPNKRLYRMSIFAGNPAGASSK